VNLMMLLEMARSGFPDRVAVTSGDVSLRYDELFAMAGAAAKALRETGARHAALLDVSSPALPVALFAGAWAGLPFAPLNYRLSEPEVAALLERLAPAALVTDAERAEAVAGRSDTHALARERFLELARAAGDPGEWPADPEAIAVLLFTSGTTGAPKAAVLRQRHLVSYILGSVEFGAAAEDEATLVSVPPYHVAGIAAILSSIYAGRRIVQLPAFSPDAWLETARREGVTQAFVVPTMLARIVEALEGRESADLPRLRALAYGGGKMPQAVIERAMRLFPETAFTNAYGLTETSSTITVLTPEDHRAAAESTDPARRRRLVSVGRPIPGVEVEIRDESGRALGPGQRGEIHVRGEQVAGEYLEQGSRLLPGGWFPTRDAGLVDEEGYLFLEGRIDDVIVRGGENMSPGEIEDVLLAHPDVADCAVVGVPDEEWGEAVAAAVVPRPGAAPDPDALRAWVRERLRSSRAPQVVAFREALPYNETGKLLRRVIRAELSEAADTAGAGS